MQSSSWLVITVLCAIVKSIAGGGYLKVKLISYENKYGHDRYMSYCDPKTFGGKTSDCDLKMTLTLDARNNGLGPHWSSMKSHTFFDRNSIYNFPFFGNHRNPIRKTFSKWMGKLYVGLDVVDVDAFSDNDHVDSLTKTFAVSPDGISRKHTINGYIHRHNSKFVFSVEVGCNKNFYAPACTKYCRARDDGGGHYTCDRFGNKRCLRGWRDATNHCRDVDSCFEKRCLNGGRCREIDRTARCECQAGFYGLQCEKKLQDLCRNLPCMNGGNCSIYRRVASCKCDSPFFGVQCELCNSTAVGGNVCPTFDFEPASLLMSHQGKKIISIHPAAILVPLLVFLAVIAFVIYRQWKRVRPYLPSFLQSKDSTTGNEFDNTYYSATARLSNPDREEPMVREVANNIYDIEESPYSDDCSSHEDVDDGSYYGSLDDNNSVFEDPKDCLEDQRHQPHPPALPPRNPLPSVVTQDLNPNDTVSHV